MPKKLTRFFNLVPVPQSATPTFDGAIGHAFEFTLTKNVTSSLATGFAPGAPFFLILAQDATGGRTFTWPANYKNPPVVDLAANSKTSCGAIMRADGNFYPWLGWS